MRNLDDDETQSKLKGEMIVSLSDQLSFRLKHIVELQEELRVLKESKELSDQKFVEYLATWHWNLNKHLVAKIESQCEKCNKNPTHIPDWEPISEDSKEGQREVARKMLEEFRRGD